MTFAKLSLLSERTPASLNSYDFLVSEIKKRLARGKNVIIVVDGDTGSGKSTLCLRLAADLDQYWINEPLAAAKNLVVFSAAEFLSIVHFLLRGGEEWFRHRFIVFEEAGAGMRIGAAGAVQESKKVLEVFRQWQISVIFNVPDREIIRDVLYEHAHHVIWCRDVNFSERVTIARWKQRYRSESKIAFVNPYLLREGIVYSRVPGALLRVSWAPSEIWEPYQREKEHFFELLTERSLKRIKRLSKVRGDLSEAIAREQFENLVGEEINELEIPDW